MTEEIEKNIDNPTLLKKNNSKIIDSQNDLEKMLHDIWITSDFLWLPEWTSVIKNFDPWYYLEFNKKPYDAKAHNREVSRIANENKWNSENYERVIRDFKLNMLSNKLIGPPQIDGTIPLELDTKWDAFFDAEKFKIQFSEFMSKRRVLLTLVNSLKWIIENKNEPENQVKQLQELYTLDSSINVNDFGIFWESLFKIYKDFSWILEEYSKEVTKNIKNPELLVKLVEPEKWRNSYLLRNPYFPNEEILKILSKYEKNGKLTLDGIPNHILYPILWRQNLPDKILNQIFEDPYAQSHWISTVWSILVRFTPNKVIFEYFLRQFEETQWQSKHFSEFNNLIHVWNNEDMAVSLLNNPLVNDTYFKERVARLLARNNENKNILSNFKN